MSETVHIVGPVWNGGEKNEDALLANCYRNALLPAQQRDLKTIAFPAISAGIYRFPVERAARIALREIRAFLAEHPTPEKVILVCFEERVYEALQAEAQTASPQ